jgi:hypothetical protein
MSLFSKPNEHLFAGFEKSLIEKKFLNIFKLIKSKDIEFLSRYENDEKNNYHTSNHTLAYDFLIYKKKVTFTGRKITILSLENFEDRYNNFASYLFSGKYYLGKQSKGNNSFIGIPKLISDDFPYTILEIESLILDKKNYKKNIQLREYLSLFNLANSWRKEVESGFNIISNKIIKETLNKIK